MNLLVFQHIECEHPGSLRQFPAGGGVNRDTVNLDQGEPIPDLDGYDALCVMGGPQAMRVGENAWSMQFYIELEPDTIANCAAVPAYYDALMASIGPGGFETMKSASGEAMPEFTDSAGKL